MIHRSMCKMNHAIKVFFLLLFDTIQLLLVRRPPTVQQMPVHITNFAILTN